MWASIWAHRMPVTRRTRKPKTILYVRVQLQGKNREVKAVEIEVMVVDKVVPNVLVDGGSGSISYPSTP